MNAPGGGVHTAEIAHRSSQPRQRGARWLWLLVLAQLAIPAAYYLGGERDDERFAWRMFSAVRVQRCSVLAFAVATSGEKTPVNLDAALHSAWIRALERGRERVIERFLGQHCARSRGTRVDLLRSCKDAARRATGRERFSIDCPSGKLSREPQP